MEVVLTRSADDRRRYDLPGVGTMTWLRRIAYDAELVTVDGTRLVAATQGWTQGAATATGADGSGVGGYRRSRWTSHAGLVSWRGQDLEIVSEHRWRSRFALQGSGGVVVRASASGWGRRPAKVWDVAPGSDPGLVLFAVWLVQAFVAQDQSTGG